MSIEQIKEKVRQADSKAKIKAVYEGNDNYLIILDGGNVDNSLLLNKNTEKLIGATVRFYMSNDVSKMRKIYGE